MEVATIHSYEKFQLLPKEKREKQSIRSVSNP